jgi:hypothetical protein
VEVIIMSRAWIVPGFIGSVLSLLLCGCGPEALDQADLDAYLGLDDFDKADSATMLPQSVLVELEKNIRRFPFRFDRHLSGL